MTDLQLAHVERLFSLIGGVGALVAFFVLVREKFFRGITWRKALREAEKVLVHIESQSWRPEVVVGLGRSGALWGGWLAGNLGSLPVCVLDRGFAASSGTRRIVFNDGEELVGILRRRFGENARVLVVEGANTSGQPFIAFSELVRQSWPGCQTRFAALYSNKASPFSADFVGNPGIDPYPDRFPWHFRPSYRRNLGLDSATPR